MADAPRRLPPTPGQRQQAEMSRMSPGALAGGSLSVKPVPSSPLNAARAVIPVTISDADPVMIGLGSYADAPGQVAVGAGSSTTDLGTAVGAHSKAASSAVSIGDQAGDSGTQQYAVCVGTNSYSESSAAVAIGLFAQVRDATHVKQSGVAIGNAAQVVDSENGVAINGAATGDHSTSINGSVLATGGIAIGRDSTGAPATASTSDDAVIGTALHKVSVPGLFAVHGATPVAQSAAPTTLADVIAVLRAHGLCA